MSVGLTAPGDIGEAVAEAIADMVQRATNGAPVSTYAQSDSPLTWQAIEDGGWDLIGTDEDAQLRDLAEVARAWGRACIQLPFIPSLLAKRHSGAAQAESGPVSFSVPSATLPESGLVPYGQLDLKVARGLGAGVDELAEGAGGGPEEFDILLRGARAPFISDFSPEAARETAVLFAAEAAGAAARLLDDGIAFVKERQQFGKPVGSFQAVKHHLANALIDAEMAETAVIWASLNPAEAYRGSLFAITRSIAVGELVLQAHGGIGFTWELGLHFLLRRMVAARDLVTGLESAYA